jgi:hypothetical protein
MDWLGIDPRKLLWEGAKLLMLASIVHSLISNNWCNTKDFFE